MILPYCRVLYGKIIFLNDLRASKKNTRCIYNFVYYQNPYFPTTYLLCARHSCQPWRYINSDK